MGIFHSGALCQKPNSDYMPVVQGIQGSGSMPVNLGQWMYASRNLDIKFYQQTSVCMPGLNANLKLQASQNMTTRLKAQAYI